MRRFDQALLTSLSLTSVDGAPKHRRLYHTLRDAIVAGRLGAGSAVPSTRALAQALGVSRNTVSTAFDQLVAEGFIESRIGSGSFVSQRLATRAARSRPGRTPSAQLRLSARGTVLAAQRVRPIGSTERLQALRSGTPALDQFPRALWARLTARCIKHGPPDCFGYADSAGYRPLREAIAAYLTAARGVRCSADQVVVTVGSQQALDLTSRLLLAEGDGVWVEDPAYRGARAAFAGNGARVFGIPVDAEGIDVAAGRQRAGKPRLIYVTPSSQFPLGMTMTLDRRAALLAFARATRSWIFEDDYDSEFRYVGRPLAALQGLDEDDRVIYAGTFSKVLFPSLRLGYVVVPHHVSDAFAAARSVTDRQPPGVDQWVLARFMEQGHFARHIARMRDLYRERQTALIEAARKHLDGLLDIQPRSAGMHVVGFLSADADDVEVAGRAQQHGVDAVALSGYYVEARPRRGLLLGFTSDPPADIRAAVQRLRDVLKRC